MTTSWLALADYSERGGPSAADRPPAGAVHLGLGAFHRSHQAWYTELANQRGADQFGIWAFSGRRPEPAQLLSQQDCRYTLIERSAAGDHPTMINSIVRADHGGDVAAWRTAMADPGISLLTLTITEVGYRLGEDDHERLRSGVGGGSAVARIVDGLAARRNADAGPLAIVPCDNLPANGAFTHDVVLDLARAVDEDLAGWIAEQVSFVSTMVDRITPATTAADIAVVQDLVGWADACPVIAEPFSEWVLSGVFPAGRPAWEHGGALIVDDVAPYEQRKLWLLNGGHSLLAYLGLLRGHLTVDEAMQDALCVAVLEQLWDEAAPVLPFDATEIETARQALRDRFTNPRIRHQLTQIAMDGSLKLPLRVLNVHRARRAVGLDVGSAGATALAAWIAHLKTDFVNDRGATELITTLAAGGSRYDQVRAVVAALDPTLVDDEALVEAIVHAYESLTAAGGNPLC